MNPSDYIDIFRQASRLKLRYPSAHGDLNTEDLWDLPITAGNRGASLENIGNTLLAQQKNLADTSILAESTPSAAKVRCDLSVEIVRHIIATKQRDAEAKTAAATRASEATRLRELIRTREAAELPIDALKAQLDALTAAGG